MISKVKGERETPHWFFISLVVSSKKGGSALVLNFLSAPFSLFGISGDAILNLAEDRNH